MTTKAIIISEINLKVGSYASIFRIGITHTPDERKQYWSVKENIKYWSQWRADSLSDAQDIESYFINERQMKGGTSGDMSSRYFTYIYVF
jgi:hypothetical protein